LDLAGKDLVVWLSPEAIETFLGVLEPSQEHAMTTWTVAGQVVGEAGPGLWVRVKGRVHLPNGEELPPLREEPVYFLRWELVTNGVALRRAAGGHSAYRVRRTSPALPKHQAARRSRRLTTQEPGKLITT
jgi:hypothetical protein